MIVIIGVMGTMMVMLIIGLMRTAGLGVSVW